MTRRPYQKEALREFIEALNRMFALLWERQSGKSTTFADMAFFEMLRYVDRTCIYASASLLLGTEIILKQSQRKETSIRDVVEKEAAIFAGLRDGYSAQAKKAGMLFQTANGDDDKIISETLKPADFAQLFEEQKLEFRVYHDRSRYSRTKVIAPNVATARSWSGTVFLDEVAFIRGLKELITALLPIISARKEFKLIYGTTPPEFDDTHYSFELLAPPAGTEFKPNAAGNWYESESGVRVHRADAYDTHLAGKQIFDLKSGAAITPQEAFRRAPNKDGHRIAHLLWWMLGGTAACDMLRLKVAQERGVGTCQCFVIDDHNADIEFTQGVNWLAEHLDPKAKVGLGFDVATTTKEKSNPSAVSVVEEHGSEVTVRALFVWKTRDPDVARERLDRIVDVISARPDGGRPRALAIDATNEKYFAKDVRKQFRSKMPVLQVVSSESYESPGLEKPINWKEYLGDQYVAKLEDNHLTLPPERYIFQDHRLVQKDRGKFVCEPDDQGRHGDTFDAAKLGVHAVCRGKGTAWAAGASVGSFQGATG